MKPLIMHYAEVREYFNQCLEIRTCI